MKRHRGHLGVLLPPQDDASNRPHILIRSFAAERGFAINALKRGTRGRSSLKLEKGKKGEELNQTCLLLTRSIQREKIVLCKHRTQDRTNESIGIQQSLISV